MPGTPTPQRRSWWSRNWLWVVPTGCLTLIAVVVAFVALIVAVVFGAMKSSDVYKLAVATARENPAVVQALGTPIKEGLFLSGSTNVNGASGDANLAIPISGPKGKGKIYAVATKSAGRWSYSTLEVEVDGRERRINLLGGDSAPAANDET
jgi:hypothetical protein